MTFQILEHDIFRNKDPIRRKYFFFFCIVDDFLQLWLIISGFELLIFALFLLVFFDSLCV